jgi:hypothetical protein
MKLCHLAWTVMIVALMESGACHSQSVPLKDIHAGKMSSRVRQWLTVADWNKLFPHRYGIGLQDSLYGKRDFYSFDAFVKASALFPRFLSDGSRDDQRRELAAFLAHIAQETSGGWEQAPGGYFSWGLYFLTERAAGPVPDYADTSKHNYPPVPGKQYYGRGPAQLSWNYNYGQFSEAWYGTRDSLLEHPERLQQDPVLSMASAIWFWMTPQPPKPSCHQVVVGAWTPNTADSVKGRLPGFGATVNIINGGIECGTGAVLKKTSRRLQYYQLFCQYLKVDPGPNLSCSGQVPFNR